MEHKGDSMSEPVTQKMKLPEWLSINPWAIVMVVSALILGILLGAQHGKLPELANIIVGPAVGSFLAVGAGAWLANWQERRRRTEAKLFLMPILNDISTSLEKAINGYAPYEARFAAIDDDDVPEGQIEAAMVIKRLGDDASKIGRRLNELRTAFGSMGFQGNVVFADAQEIMKRIQERLERHYVSQADIVAGHSLETVADLVGLWRWSDQLNATTRLGRFTPSTTPLPEAVRNDRRWNPLT